MRLIDADALRKDLVETLRLCEQWMADAKDDETKVVSQANWFAFLEAKLRLDSAPTIDAVPVIRCKDCKWWTKQEKSIQGRCALTGTYPTGGWYCGNGERRDDEIDRR